MEKEQLMKEIDHLQEHIAKWAIEGNTAALCRANVDLAAMVKELKTIQDAEWEEVEELDWEGSSVDVWLGHRMPEEAAPLSPAVEEEIHKLVEKVAEELDGVNQGKASHDPDPPSEPAQEAPEAPPSDSEPTPPLPPSDPA